MIQINDSTLQMLMAEVTVSLSILLEFLSKLTLWLLLLNCVAYLNIPPLSYFVGYLPAEIG